MTPVDPTSGTLGTEPVTPPPGVRFESADQEQLYRAALEFERFFVQEMLKDVDSGSMLGEDEAGGAGLSGYRDMAKDQLTDSVLDGGGLGLAASLYGQLADQFGVQTAADDDGGAA